MAGSVSRIMVNTDDEEIAGIARQFGAEVPFLRPAHLASDLSTDFDVFYHALQWMLQHEGSVPDLVVQLRPTSPVRKAEHIEACIQRMAQNPQADSIRVVCPAPCNPYKMWRIPNDSRFMQPLLTVEGLEEAYNLPRQKLPDAYWQIGYLDVVRSNTILQLNSMSGTSILPFVVDTRFAVDIDDAESFDRAAAAIKKVGGISF
jgi:N-acylneuraminate cytidylyltransferase